MEIIIPIIIFIIVAYLKLTSSSRKGRRGEVAVEHTLRKLNSDEYKVINDVLIKTGYGSSQIDHIIVSRFGVFVIETKNFQGWIHGNEMSEYWTQTIFKEKNKFRNPIKQNWSHIYALKETLTEFKNIKYHPIVVFAGNAELKNINSSIPVIYIEQLNSEIKELSNNPIFGLNEVDAIVQKINDLNIIDKTERKNHLNYLNKTISKRNNDERKGYCPLCRGSLVRRKGKYGDFYGCSNYPKCRYTKRNE